MIVQILESMKIALFSLRANKLRSLLTLLGIAIGLFSIIIVMTAISAIQTSVEDAFNSIGTTNFIIQKMPAVRMGGHGTWRKYRNRQDLTIEQGLRLKEMTKKPLGVGIGFNRSGKTVNFNGETTNPDVRLWAGNSDEFKASNVEVEFGRGFSTQDMKYAKDVCIIGADLVKKLFERIDPIGSTIRIENKNYEVIGVFKAQGSVLGQGQDNFVAIPLTTYERKYGDRRSGSYTIIAENKESIQATMDEVIGALRVIRKVPLGEENDFEIVTNDQLIEQFNDITKYFKIGAAVIAFIALIAAGIGIMNIMLVSVTERTREIGIRKAIGAQKRMIRIQFVVEAIVLSQIGGLIGIGLGLAGGNIVAVMMNVSLVLPIDWIIIGLTVTTLVGVVFGVYPAIKASNLDPIEALRYE